MQTNGSRSWRLKLGTALCGMMLISVLATAATVHFSWRQTSQANVDRIVSAMNENAASSIRRGLQESFQSSEGAVEIIRSIFFQGAIKPGDEAKREFVFLPVLRSQPAISWLALAFPDGRFFGAHALAGQKVEMVEIGAVVDETARSLRRDRYAYLPGDIFFEERQWGSSQYVAPGSRWYREAVKTKAPVWSSVDILPSGFEPAAVISTPLLRNGRLEGVLMASISLDHLSEMLSSLEIARAGSARIINEAGTVIAKSAAPSPEAGEPGEALVSRQLLGFNGWQLETSVSRSYFTADIDRKVKQLAIFITGLAILAALGSAFLASIFFARPIRRIVAELGHIENFRLSEVKHVASNLAELDDLSSALQRMAASLSAFAKFVPAEIVRSLLSHGIEPKPGGEQREITVMFADLPGFTRMTEQFGDAITPFLTEFLTLATKAVHEEGGIVDKFIGDCIMGIWNAYGDDPDHAVHAARAASKISKLIRDIRRPDGESPAHAVRIGLATGHALVGNIGSTERLSYTAVGDAVNIASRLEGMGKEFGVGILLNEEAKRRIAGSFTVRDLGETAIRGRNGKLRAYELVEPSSAVPEALRHEPVISIR